MYTCNVEIVRCRKVKAKNPIREIYFDIRFAYVVKNFQPSKYLWMIVYFAYFPLGMLRSSYVD